MGPPPRGHLPTPSSHPLDPSPIPPDSIELADSTTVSSPQSQRDETGLPQEGPDMPQDGPGAEGGPRRRRRRNSNAPSYAQSEFFEITRRQRIRTTSNALKLPRHLLSPVRSRSPAFPPIASTSSSPSTPFSPPHHHGADGDLPILSSDKAPPKLENAWEFAGWGTESYLELSTEEVESARRRREEEGRAMGEGTLGAWMASGVAGVAVAGSPLYAFPALVAVASIYSPISLLIATLLLSFYRPIMAELVSALPISGANYAYLLNSSSSVTFALVGASLTILDDIATSVVAAATAASYIANEGISGAETWLTVVLIVGVAAIGLVGVRGSAGVTLATLGIHLTVLSILFVSALAHWVQHGNSTLFLNWTFSQLPSASSTVKALFQGICISFLGVTGIESTPDYVSSLRPEASVYPTALRSLQVIAVAINAPLLLAVFAVLPMEDVLDNASVLSTLGTRAAGRWLGVLVTVDAVLILSATILAGLVSALALLHRMAQDGYLPRVLLKPLPVTGVPGFVVVLFTALSVVVWLSSGASLNVVSNMFALVFLSVMAFYPLSLLVLHYNRPSLPRRSSSPFLLTLSTLFLSLTLIAGVIWTQPISVGYFAAYGVAILTMVLGCAKKGRLVKVAWWICKHGLGWQRGAERCVRWMGRGKKGREVVLFVKGDEINTLFQRISYVERNEETNCVKLVHFYGNARTIHTSTEGAAVATKSKEDLEVDVTEAAGGEGGFATPATDSSGVEDIPSELEANFRILDEAFPSITIDLIFLQAPFSPPYIHALAQRLGLSAARCFMGCPSPSWSDEREWGVRELAGVRIIAE